MGANGFRGFNPYMTVKEAAEMLRISPARVLELIEQCRLRSDPIRKGHPRCINLGEIQRYIEVQ